MPRHLLSCLHFLHGTAHSSGHSKMPFIPGHVCFLQRRHECVFHCCWPSGTTRRHFAGRSSSGSTSLNKLYIFRAETRVSDCQLTNLLLRVGWPSSSGIPDELFMVSLLCFSANSVVDRGRATWRLKSSKCDTSESFGWLKSTIWSYISGRGRMWGFVIRNKPWVGIGTHIWGICDAGCEIDSSVDIEAGMFAEGTSIMSTTPWQGCVETGAAVRNVGKGWRVAARTFRVCWMSSILPLISSWDAFILLTFSQLLA